uniref:Uncharacterized protein n=1 Tax=Oryza punctata TaxID=4537 RepID=A0A0E0M2P8_ORYPU
MRDAARCAAGDASSVRLPQGRRKGGRLVDTYLVESVLEAVLRLAEFEENSLAPCSLATDVLDLPPVPATADRFAGQGIYLTDSSRRRDYIISFRKCTALQKGCIDLCFACKIEGQQTALDLGCNITSTGYICYSLSN